MKINICFACLNDDFMKAIMSEYYKTRISQKYTISFHPRVGVESLYLENNNV